MDNKNRYEIKKSKGYKTIYDKISREDLSIDRIIELLNGYEHTIEILKEERNEIYKNIDFLTEEIEDYEAKNSFYGFIIFIELLIIIIGILMII